MLSSQGIIDGLARVLRAENGESVIVTASLEKTRTLASTISKLVARAGFWTESQDYEIEYRQINGIFNISRLMPSHKTTREVHLNSIPFQLKKEALSACSPLKLHVAAPGLLDSLHFIENDITDAIAPDEV